MWLLLFYVILNMVRTRFYNFESIRENENFILDITDSRICSIGINLTFPERHIVVVDGVSEQQNKMYEFAFV